MWHWFYIYIHIKMYIFFWFLRMICEIDFLQRLHSASCFPPLKKTHRGDSLLDCVRLRSTWLWMKSKLHAFPSKKMRLKYGRLRCTSLSSYRHANITLKSEWQLFLALVNLAVDIWHDNYVPFVLIMDFLLQLIRRRFWCFLNNIHWEILDSWSVR